MKPPPHRQIIRVIDSHTGGEPTRVIVEGGPDLGSGSLTERRERFRRDFDHFRSAVVNEPRGADLLVGALLVPPSDPTCLTGVIFFNNVGYLNMCGHGTIGLIVTLADMGRVGSGTHRIETPVGVVVAELDSSGKVSVENVPSYRHRKAVAIDLDGHDRLVGDIAWGGNWFFLTSDHRQELSISRVRELTALAQKIRIALRTQGRTGADNMEIDHIEFFGPPQRANADSRNFVLCPGGAYDRSPCGTGTCAKLACLYEDGLLAEGQIWRQESIVGSVFEGWLRVTDGVIHPTIRSTAYVTAETTLILEEGDPFRWGIR